MCILVNLEKIFESNKTNLINNFLKKLENLK